MANELTKYESGLVSKAAGSGGIGELLKPLSQEIHLFDSFVAGTSHLADQTVLDEIKEGDMLFLVREDNKFDSNAIMLLSTAKKKVGYVPEKDNVVFARLMDAGKKLSAKITKIEKKGSFTKIAVSIFLVDF
ncbi:MAG: HIRAN domain-containing protein [Clostridiales bacterium]|nr:HIRAN domain-containing protein [Clostridiales bacterium]